MELWWMRFSDLLGRVEVSSRLSLSQLLSGQVHLKPFYCSLGWSLFSPELLTQACLPSISNSRTSNEYNIKLKHMINLPKQFLFIPSSLLYDKLYYLYHSLSLLVWEMKRWSHFKIRRNRYYKSNSENASQGSYKSKSKALSPLASTTLIKIKQYHKTANISSLLGSKKHAFSINNA